MALNDIKHVSEFHWECLRQILAIFSKIWNGNIGKTNVTCDHINLMPEARSVTKQRYCMGPRSREFGATEIDWKCKVNIINPSTAERASPVVIVAKQDGLYRMWTNNRKLNPVAICNTYSFPGMAECINFLWDAVVFSTLNANWGYKQMLASGWRKQEQDYLHQPRWDVLD